MKAAKYLIVATMIFCGINAIVGCAPCYGATDYEYEHTEESEYINENGHAFYAVVDFQRNKSAQESKGLSAKSVSQIASIVYQETEKYIGKPFNKMILEDLKEALSGFHVYGVHNKEEFARIFCLPVDEVIFRGAGTIAEPGRQCWPIPDNTRSSVIFQRFSYNENEHETYKTLIHEMLHHVSQHIYSSSDAQHLNYHLWLKFGEHSIGYKALERSLEEVF